MSNKIGHFEILSELAKSATGEVYKANDPQSNQTVALKAIQLSVFGESAAALAKCLLEEAATTKPLSHPNVIPVYGAGEIDGQFCAAMEYIQGNSIATMLTRKEGFSIWDILDIGRQVCAGLDHARSHDVFHYSLEPAKIMCGWDGAVRILGYGVSTVGKFTAQMPGLPLILHYMSPEQIRGENIDERSNLFSLAAIFYEMITDRKAFDGDNSDAVRRNITETIPVAPVAINQKAHPVLSGLIMKALAKDPAERYQNAKELLEDLEKCKETKPQAAKQKAAPAQGLVVPDAVKAANQAKFIASAPAGGPATPPPAASAPLRSSAAAAGVSQASATLSSAPKIQTPGKVTPPRARPPVSTPPAVRPSAPVLTAPVLDAPPQAPQIEAPKITVDPMMAQDGPAPSGGVSFSEMTELPPLKEDYIPAPPPPPPVFEPKSAQHHSVTTYDGEVEKPKIQPREVAEKAMKEIKNVPPRLMVYSIAAAAVLILIIAVALVMHVNSLNNDGDSPRPAAAVSQPEPVRPHAQAQPAPQAAPQSAPAPPPEAQPSEPVAQAQPEAAEAPAAHSRGKNARKKPAPAAPVMVPGQMAIDSTPQGVEIQIDGKTDPAWVTPITLSGLGPGQHSITFSKSGYVTDTRTVAVTSGGKLSVTTRLVPLTATLSVASTPAGANVYIDGKDTHKLTPTQVSVDKGQHVVLVRKSGYIDETTSAQFVLGQTTNFSPSLRALGNVDDIKTVGKMKKLFGGKEAQGMGTVSIKTQPKGAQVAVNQHMLDKDSPVDFMLDPGNYIVDITMSGYAPIHKVITVDKGGKAVIDEVLQRE